MANYSILSQNLKGFGDSIGNATQSIQNLGQSVYNTRVKEINQKTNAISVRSFVDTRVKEQLQQHNPTQPIDDYRELVMSLSESAFSEAENSGKFTDTELQMAKDMFFEEDNLGQFDATAQTMDTVIRSSRIAKNAEDTWGMLLSKQDMGLKDKVEIYKGYYEQWALESFDSSYGIISPYEFSKLAMGEDVTINTSKALELSMRDPANALRSFDEVYEECVSTAETALDRKMTKEEKKANRQEALNEWQENQSRIQNDFNAKYSLAYKEIYEIQQKGGVYDLSKLKELEDTYNPVVIQNSPLYGLTLGLQDENAKTSINKFLVSYDGNVDGVIWEDVTSELYNVGQQQEFVDSLFKQQFVLAQEGKVVYDYENLAQNLRDNGFQDIDMQSFVMQGNALNDGYRKEKIDKLISKDPFSEETYKAIGELSDETLKKGYAEAILQQAYYEAIYDDKPMDKAMIAKFENDFGITVNQAFKNDVKALEDTMKVKDIANTLAVNPTSSEAIALAKTLPDATQKQAVLNQVVNNLLSDSVLNNKEVSLDEVETLKNELGVDLDDKLEQSIKNQNEIIKNREANREIYTGSIDSIAEHCRGLQDEDIQQIIGGYMDFKYQQALANGDSIIDYSDVDELIEKVSGVKDSVYHNYKAKARELNDSRWAVIADKNIELGKSQGQLAEDYSKLSADDKKGWVGQYLNRQLAIAKTKNQKVDISQIESFLVDELGVGPEDTQLLSFIAMAEENNSDIAFGTARKLIGKGSSDELTRAFISEDLSEEAKAKLETAFLDYNKVMSSDLTNLNQYDIDEMQKVYEQSGFDNETEWQALLQDVKGYNDKRTYINSMLEGWKGKTNAQIVSKINNISDASSKVSAANSALEYRALQEMNKKTPTDLEEFEGFVNQLPVDDATKLSYMQKVRDANDVKVALDVQAKFGNDDKLSPTAKDFEEIGDTDTKEKTVLAIYEQMYNRAIISGSKQAIEGFEEVWVGAGLTKDANFDEMQAKFKVLNEAVLNNDLYQAYIKDGSIPTEKQLAKLGDNRGALEEAILTSYLMKETNKTGDIYVAVGNASKWAEEHGFSDVLSVAQDNVVKSLTAQSELVNKQNQINNDFTDGILSKASTEEEGQTTEGPVEIIDGYTEISNKEQGIGRYMMGLGTMTDAFSSSTNWEAVSPGDFRSPNTLMGNKANFAYTSDYIDSYNEAAALAKKMDNIMADQHPLSIAASSYIENLAKDQQVPKEAVEMAVNTAIKQGYISDSKADYLLSLNRVDPYDATWDAMRRMCEEEAAEVFPDDVSARTFYEQTLKASMLKTFFLDGKYNGDDAKTWVSAVSKAGINSMMDTAADKFDSYSVAFNTNMYGDFAEAFTKAPLKDHLTYLQTQGFQQMLDEDVLYALESQMGTYWTYNDDILYDNISRALGYGAWSEVSDDQKYLQASVKLHACELKTRRAVAVMARDTLGLDETATDNLNMVYVQGDRESLGAYYVQLPYAEDTWLTVDLNKIEDVTNKKKMQNVWSVIISPKDEKTGGPTAKNMSSPVSLLSYVGVDDSTSLMSSKSRVEATYDKADKEWEANLSASEEGQGFHSRETWDAEGGRWGSTQEDATAYRITANWVGRAIEILYNNAKYRGAYTGISMLPKTTPTEQFSK